jgi:hypothetical protein
MHELTQLTKRRSQLIQQIETSRRELSGNLGAARKEIAVAGLGFLAHRFLAKHPILRTLAITALALSTRTSMFAQLDVRKFFSSLFASQKKQ